jgi:ABC-2 type transport system ATP-binding protein
MKAIEVNNLKKKFGNKLIVKGLTFDVYEGEIFGFIGRNGAGKSTTVNMLTGISHPTEGSFRILGQENIDLVKKDIGVMPDAANYYYEMTALEHLKFFAGVKNIKPTTIELMNILKKVGLEGNERKKVKAFSFGMKKKLGVAQALIGNPRVLFLDEPTSGLDIQSSLEIQQLILNMAKEKRTIFMTSHNLAEVEKICSRIAIIEDGVINKYGSMEDLQKKYTNEQLVSIEIGQISPEKVEKITGTLSPYAIETHYKEGRIYCRIEDRRQTPNIIFALCKEEIEIFEVKQEKATLEEIFLR